MTGFFKCSIPSPGHILTALILWPQATILFATLANVSVWRAMWLSTLLFLSYIFCTVLSANARFTRALFTAIPDRQTLHNTLYLFFALGLPLAVIGTLFYQHPLVRQLSLLTWSIFIFLPATLASRQQLDLHFDATLTYLFLHHLALFASLHIGFAWGIPFKLTLALSLFATFIKLSKNRTVSSLPASPRSSPKRDSSSDRERNSSERSLKLDSFSQDVDDTSSTSSTPRRRSRRSTYSH